MSFHLHGDLTPVPNRPGIAARVLAGPEQGVTSLFIVEDRLEQGATIPLHTHPVDEVLIITAGELTVDVGDERATVGDGQTVVIPPGTPHRLANHGAADVHLLAAAPADRRTFYTEGSHYLEGEPRG